MQKTAFALLLVVGVALAAVPEPTSQYYAKFTVSMPTMPLMVPEEIEIWYDGEGKNEIVSYFGGLDTNAFLTNDGGAQEAFQVSPTGAPGKKTEYECWTSGINTAPFMFSAFPKDLSGFEAAGQETVNGVTCNVYTWNQPPVAGTTNNMTLYLDASSDSFMPVKLVYIGFTGIFNSPNYDWFVVDYEDYKPNYFDPSVFVVPSECSDAKTSHSMPSARFHAHRVLPWTSEDETHEYFLEYKQKFGRTYADDSEEHESRFAAFKKNLAKVIELNRNAKGKTRFTMNHVADLANPNEGTGRMPARKVSMEPRDDIDYYVPKTKSIDELPSSFDWRQKGVVPALREQGDCGSCWTFGSVAAMDAHYAIKYGVQPPTSSEQFVLDCAWDLGGQACNGGTADIVYNLVKEAGGIPSEASYPYLMQNGICNTDVPKNYTISGSKGVFPGDLHAMMDAVVNEGPVAVGVDANDAWTFYHSGFMTTSSNPHCTAAAIDHEVFVVGYTTNSDGEIAVIIQNSWSKFWGDGGFIYIAQNDGNDNLCGVLAEGRFPIV